MPTRTKFLIGLSLVIIFVLVVSGLTTIYQVYANPTICPPIGPDRDRDFCGFGDGIALLAGSIIIIASVPFLMVLLAVWFKSKFFSRIIFPAFLLLSLWAQIGIITEEFSRPPGSHYFMLGLLFVIVWVYYALLFNKRTLRYANFL